jgi:hypothetical protein
MNQKSNLFFIYCSDRCLSKLLHFMCICVCASILFSLFLTVVFVHYIHTQQYPSYLTAHITHITLVHRYIKHSSNINNKNNIRSSSNKKNMLFVIVKKNTTEKIYYLLVHVKHFHILSTHFILFSRKRECLGKRVKKKNKMRKFCFRSQKIKMKWKKGKR